MDSVYIIQYEDNIFLMFESDSKLEKEKYILVYQLEEGFLRENFKMYYEYRNMKVVAVQNDQEYEK